MIEIALRYLAGPISSAALKKVMSAANGGIGRDVLKIARDSLRSAIDESLSNAAESAGLETPGRKQREIVFARLQKDLNLKQDRWTFVEREADSTGVALRAWVPTLSWDTTFVEVNGHRLQVDLVDVLNRWFATFNRQLRVAASANGSKLENLVNALDSAASTERQREMLASVSAVTPVGTARDQVESADRARQAQRRILANAAAKDPYEVFTRNIVKGRVDRLLGDWVSELDWRTRVASAVAQVRQGCEAVGSPASQATATFDVLDPRECSYSVVLAAVRSMDLSALADALWPRDEARAPIDPRHQTLLGPARDALDWLRQEEKDPRFGYTVNLIGSFGSGRTRALREYGSRADNNGELVLFLALSPGEDLAVSLLRQAARILGREYRAVIDLGRALEGMGLRLNVLVDELDRQPASTMSGLGDVLYDCSETTSFRWMFTADSRRANRVIVRDDPLLWARFGYVPDPSLSGEAETGWIDLDKTNHLEMTGIKMIQSALGRRSAPLMTAISKNSGDVLDVETILADPDRFPYEKRHLVNPLQAAVRIASEDSRTPLTDVNHPEFVGLYWTYFQRWAALDSAQAARLDDLIDHIGKLADSGSPVITLSMQWAAHQPELDLLESAGLIATLPPPEPTTADAGPRKPRLQLTFEPFWAERLSHDLDPKVLKGKSRGGRSTPIREVWPQASRWFDRANEDETIAEGVLQFALLRIVSNPGQIPSPATWARDRLAPRPPLLAAGLSDPLRLGEAAVDVTEHDDYAPVRGREQFLALRLASRLERPAWSTSSRIRLIKKVAPTTVATGLLTYVRSTLALIIDDPAMTTSTQFAEMCAELTDFDLGDRTYSIASQMISAGERIFGDGLDDWALTTWRYYKSISSRSTPDPDRASQQVLPRQQVGPSSRRRRYKVNVDDWANFFNAYNRLFFEHVLTTDPRNGYETLVDHGWAVKTPDGVHKDRAERATKSLHATYGQLWRSGGNILRRYHLRTVERLIDGDLLTAEPERQRAENACFLILQTNPSTATNRYRVHPSFRPSVRRLNALTDLSTYVRSQIDLLVAANSL